MLAYMFIAIEVIIIDNIQNINTGFRSNTFTTVQHSILWLHWFRRYYHKLKLVWICIHAIVCGTTGSHSDNHVSGWVKPFLYRAMSLSWSYHQRNYTNYTCSGKEHNINKNIEQKGAKNRTFGFSLIQYFPWTSTIWHIHPLHPLDELATRKFTCGCEKAIYIHFCN